MTRILCTVEYDGTAYAGWQRQLNGLAVQQVVEEKLSQVCRTPVTITGASRTDAGVHALGQAFHFDTESRVPPEKWPFVLNTLLPRDIRVHTGRAVPDGFHARFMTCGKRYTYRICNSRHGTAIGRNNHAHVALALDEARMERAAQTLLGRHDFAAFQAAGGTANTTVRKLCAAHVTRSGDTVTLVIEGDAFLYNMVRIIAGTLIEIGQGRRGEDAFARAISSGNRLDLGVTAPACGLELTRVDYPAAVFENPLEVRWHQE